MSQYLISVHHTGEFPDVSEPDAEMLAAFERVGAFNDKLMANGNWVFAGGLMAPSTATVVDATGSDVLITDGPYAETKEQLGGFWVIEAPDLDAALAIGQDASVACQDAVEVRPFGA